jgi:glycopeptide antibiotics resistance protein
VKRWEIASLVGGAVVILVADYPWGDFRDHTHWDRVSLIPFFSGLVGPRDLLGNLALGIPVGLASGLIFRRRVSAALMITGLCALIGEWLQVYSHARFPSATDVVCNLTGAGAAAYTVAWVKERYNVRR